jgi:hypothetical protein
VHGDQPDDAEWAQRWALAAPLPIPGTLHIDTTGPVDVGAVIDWCTRPALTNVNVPSALGGLACLAALAGLPAGYRLH